MFVSRTWCSALVCATGLLAACAAGEGVEDVGNIFSTSVGTTMTTSMMTDDTESGSSMSGPGDGDGDGDGAPGDGDGGPGDGDGDPTSGGMCGNDIKEGDEECDGNDLGGVDCTDFGHDAGTLVCANDCTLFTNACSTCGDGQLAVTEACDGSNFGGLTCTDLGFVGGSLSCSPDCTSVIDSGCMQAPDCGNGLLDVGEACDGGNLGGQTCQSLGFDGGVLQCTGGCMIDTSGCFADMCVPLFGACNVLLNDCCPGLTCTLVCTPE